MTRCSGSRPLLVQGPVRTHGAGRSNRPGSGVARRADARLLGCALLASPAHLEALSRTGQTEETGCHAAFRWPARHTAHEDGYRPGEPWNLHRATLAQSYWSPRANADGGVA